MGCIYKDKSAVEGIPLKLIIILLILAIAIPLVWASFEHYDRVQKENELRNEIEFIITTIKSVYTNGENNSRSIDVNFKSGLAVKVERIEIGDSEDGIYSSVRYKLSSSGEVMIIIENPNIPVANKTEQGMEALIVGEGKHTLIFTARSDYDFDEDGHNELYVEVARVN